MFCIFCKTLHLRCLTGFWKRLCVLPTESALKFYLKVYFIWLILFIASQIHYLKGIKTFGSLFLWISMFFSRIFTGKTHLQIKLKHSQESMNMRNSEIGTLNQLFRSSDLEVVLVKGVMKICCKFTGEHSTSAWAFSCKFSEHLFPGTPLGGCFWLFVRGFYTQLNFQKIEVFSGKTSFFVISTFSLPFLFVLTVPFDRSVLYGNIALLIVVLSTKKRRAVLKIPSIVFLKPQKRSVLLCLTVCYKNQLTCCYKICYKKQPSIFCLLDELPSLKMCTFL